MAEEIVKIEEVVTIRKLARYHQEVLKMLRENLKEQDEKYLIMTEEQKEKLKELVKKAEIKAEELLKILVEEEQESREKQKSCCCCKGGEE